MDRPLPRWFVAVACALVSLCACAEDLVVPGSGNPEYVLRELAKAFNAHQGQHRVNVPASTGTAGALRDVDAGTTSLGRVGRPLKGSERARGFNYIPIGLDAVVFVAGAGVSVRDISRTQVLDAYSGKATDWRAFGGKPGPIRAIGREVTDASRQAIGSAIKEFGSLQFHEGVKTVHLDPQLLELLDRYPTSLGFINRSALGAASTPVQALALDGVAPTPEHLASGRYPISLEFGLVHKGGSLSPAGKAFVAFVQSPSGERLLREHGVLPISAAN